MLSHTYHLRRNGLHQEQLLRILERGNVEEGRRLIENARTNVNHVYIKKKVRIQSLQTIMKRIGYNDKRILFKILDIVY